jgi:hypothetical protein
VSRGMSSRKAQTILSISIRDLYIWAVLPLSPPLESHRGIDVDHGINVDRHSKPQNKCKCSIVILHLHSFRGFECILYLHLFRGFECLSTLILGEESVEMVGNIKKLIIFINVCIFPYSYLRVYIFRSMYIIYVHLCI